MEYLIVAIVVVIIITIARYVFDFNIKKIKQIIKNEKLDKITSKYPDNIEICKWYLKKLNNETVEIEENTSKESCLYIAVTNKILIANIKDSYSRIQTIAHECLHSIQSKKMLLFNFIFSNIYLLYFFIICLLGIFNILPNKEMYLTILVILGTLYLSIRNYLENDAMIKARYLAKDYMESISISNKEEIDEIINQYDKMNVYGIKATNFKLLFNTFTKILIFSIICLTR